MVQFVESPDVPAVKAFLDVVRKLDDRALVRIGEETKRLWPMQEVVDGIGPWLQQPQNDNLRRSYQWFDTQVTDIVQRRFETWEKESPERYIRAGLGAACAAVVMDAAGALSGELYKAALAPFQAAYGHD